MKTIATLIVYAYSSFTSSWGPGPTLMHQFETQCHCHVQLVNGGDGGSLLSRLKLEGKNTEADIVIGIDSTQIPQYKKDLDWSSAKFQLLDFAPYAFIYNENVVKTPPKSLDDLLAPQWRGQIVIEDPRLSTVGRGFLLWVIREKGEGAWDYFKKLKPQIRIVAPSWEVAYGLFKKGQAQLVFSYWTSPAYHIQEERRRDFKAAVFSSGHYVQSEFFVSSPNNKNIELKKLFTTFLLSPQAQEEIGKKNFMFPAQKEAKLSPALKEVGSVKELSPVSTKELEQLEVWLKKWREIFS